MNELLPPFAPAEAAGPLSDDEFAELAKALGHPARVAIVRRLVTEGRCVCGRIVECMSLAQSTVSQHLKVLKDAGLLLGEVDGPRVCYCVDREKLARFAAHTAGLGISIQSSGENR